MDRRRLFFWRRFCLFRTLALQPAGKGKIFFRCVGEDALRKYERLIYKACVLTDRDAERSAIMAKSENQKQKILYVLKILFEESDVDHPLSSTKLIERLESYGISVERKSLYSDIRELKEFGFDIELNDSKRGGGYYLAATEFELAEVKILIDMVQSSRFLSINQSRDLIAKLEGLVGKYGRKELHRDVYIIDRVKSDNKKVFYYVDEISSAITENKSITFRYLRYTLEGKKEFRHEGREYMVSPYFLTWNNENYYLIGYDETREDVRHYRIDRMDGLSIREENRKGASHFEKFNIAEYTNMSFGMFGGEKCRVKIEMPLYLLDTAIDRFGREASYRKAGDESFTVSANVVPSNQFFGWITGLGSGVKIASPSSLVEQYRAYLDKLRGQYD